MRDKRKGYSFRCSKKQIVEYSRLSLEEKMRWLYEANEFSRQFLRGKRLDAWESMRG